MGLRGVVPAAEGTEQIQVLAASWLLAVAEVLTLDLLAGAAAEGDRMEIAYQGMGREQLGRDIAGREGMALGGAGAAVAVLDRLESLGRRVIGPTEAQGCGRALPEHWCSVRVAAAAHTGMAECMG